MVEGCGDEWAGPHALKCYCDGPDEVIDLIWLIQSTSSVRDYLLTVIRRMQRNRFRCSDEYAFVIIETVSAVIRASTN